MQTGPRPLMPKQTFHIQPGPEGDRFETPGGERGLAEARILRRLVLEAITPLAAWAEDRDELTRQMVQGTARRHGLYEQGTNWLTVLESYCRKNLEIVCLRNQIDLTKLMSTGKSPAAERMAELDKEKKKTLVAFWHQNHGLLVATWPGTENIPEGILPKRVILGPEIDGGPMALWSWDKRNFPEGLPGRRIDMGKYPVRRILPDQHIEG